MKSEKCHLDTQKVMEFIISISVFQEMFFFFLIISEKENNTRGKRGSMQRNAEH